MRVMRVMHVVDVCVRLSFVNPNPFAVSLLGVTLTMCSFKQCQTTMDALGGGAIFVRDSTTMVNVFSSYFSGNHAATGAGDDIYRLGGIVRMYAACPDPFGSNSPNKGNSLNIFSGTTDAGSIAGSMYSYTECDYWGVVLMAELFNKISNKQKDSGPLGNAVMENGDVVKLVEGSFACTEGACAADSVMLYLGSIWGTIACEKDTKFCALDGEGTRSIMSVFGTSVCTEGICKPSEGLTLRALVFTNGQAVMSGGALDIKDGSTVYISLCTFSNSKTTGTNGSGGAIYVSSTSSGTNVQIYGTMFSNNDSNNGNDIANAPSPTSGSYVNIYPVCLEPYSTVTPEEGTALDTSAPLGGIEGTLTSHNCLKPCSASIDSDDDGSGSGKFYCINGGTVSGFAGGGFCSCNSCDAGFEGAHCETSADCVATDDPSDDGSDGNFYCVNGGTVTGSTGSCSCGNCDKDYSGDHCQNYVDCTTRCEELNIYTPCFHDPSCSAVDGGSKLGCDAHGWANCRFCEFGDYSDIDCPHTTSAPTITPSDAADGLFSITSSRMNRADCVEHCRTKAKNTSIACINNQEENTMVLNLLDSNLVEHEEKDKRSAWIGYKSGVGWEADTCDSTFTYWNTNTIGGDSNEPNGDGWAAIYSSGERRGGDREDAKMVAGKCRDPFASPTC